MMSPVTFGLVPFPLTAWSSYASESAMLTFCRSAASKFGLPDLGDVIEGDGHPRGKMHRGFAVTAVGVATPRL